MDQDRVAVLLRGGEGRCLRVTNRPSATSNEAFAPVLATTATTTGATAMVRRCKEPNSDKTGGGECARDAGHGGDHWNALYTWKRSMFDG